MNEVIPKTMRALTLPSPDEFVIQEVPVPVPGPYEVLCRVRGVAICGSDPEILRGDLAGVWPPAYPFIRIGSWRVCRSSTSFTTRLPFLVLEPIPMLAAKSSN
jgi:hypothetical protein